MMTHRVVQKLPEKRPAAADFGRGAYATNYLRFYQPHFRIKKRQEHKGACISLPKRLSLKAQFGIVGYKADKCTDGTSCTSLVRRIHLVE